LPVDIGYIFLAAGIEILQGYGLTETTAGISTNTIRDNRIGTVGKVIPNVQLKFATDGEILVKGDNITSGYFNRPDADAEAFDEEGWFRTGDIGQMDKDGFLTITDRKKDLIKTSGGKYIAPQPIENMIKGSRFISQVVVIGNGRKYASALIVPNKESLQSYAKLKGIATAGQSDLIKDEKIIDLIERQVAKFTAELARYETIKRVALLEHELTIENGEMTPTLKVKRRFVEEKYKEIIDRLYDESANPSHRAKAVDMQEA
jgi:long-chain acyl-CoA synthetase